MRPRVNKIFQWMVILSLCLLSASCDTAGSVESPDDSYFMKYYGGDGDQSAVDILLNDDGTILLLGNSLLSEASNNRMYLLKLDPQGRVLWEKMIGEEKDVAKDLERTQGGDIVVLADHTSSSVNTDIKLIILTVEGMKTDSAVYGSPGIEDAKTITPLNDQGFIIAGATEYDTATVIDPTKPDDQSDIFHFRCDASLNFLNSVQWKSQYGPGTYDAGTKVMQYSNDLFYVFGSTNQPHQDNSDGNLNLLYYSIDNGGVNGAPNYLGNFDNQTESSFVLKVDERLGGGFLVLGTETTSLGGIALHAVKLRSQLLFNSVNDIQFDKQVPFEQKRIESLSATASFSDGQGYILIGNELRETGRNIWLTKIGLDGQWKWSATYGSEEDDDRGAALVELDDGRLLLAGTVRLINNQSKMVLMKLNSKGQLRE